MFNFNKEDWNVDWNVKTKIIGVGDFGAKMVNLSIEKVLLNANFSVVATKNETLLKSSAPQRIKVTDSVDEETRKNFSELVKDIDLLFIFTDLADENISIQIAKLSKDILTVAIMPKSAPNKEKFQNSVDALISVEDENIFLMYNVVRLINGLVSEPGMVGFDYAEVKSVLGNSGKCYVSYGMATGKTPAIDAMKIAINSLKDILNKSKGVLVGIVGYYENLSMIEANEATTMLQEAMHPDAEIIWGVNSDVTYLDSVETIIIATLSGSD